MAINYTYPVKGSPVAADEFLIIDSVDNSTKKVTASSVLSLTDAVATFTAASPLVNVGDAKDVSLTLNTVPVSKGGTGLTSVGTVGQVMTATAGGGLEFTTLNFQASSWGNITGTLSAQVDLQSALNSKESTAGARYIPSTRIEVQAGETINLSDSEYDDVFMIVLTWVGGTGTTTLNLPTAVGANTNRTIRIISDSTFDAGGNHKTDVTPTGGENLDGSTNAFLINRGYEGLKIWSNGTEWFIIQQKA